MYVCTHYTLFHSVCHFIPLRSMPFHSIRFHSTQDCMPAFHSFTHSLIHSPVHSCHSMSLIHSVTHSFMHSLTRSVHSFIHSFDRSFVRSFFHSFIHSFIHSFTLSLTHSCRHFSFEQHRATELPNLASQAAGHATGWPGCFMLGGVGIKGFRVGRCRGWGSGCGVSRLVLFSYTQPKPSVILLTRYPWAADTTTYQVMRRACQASGRLACSSFRQHRAVPVSGNQFIFKLVR